MTSNDISFRQNIIIHGGVLEVLPRIPDDSFDLVLTDPPWAISQDARIVRSPYLNPDTLKSTKDIILDFGQWDRYPNLEIYLKFTYNWMKEAVRVTKPTGHLVVFFAHARTSYLVTIAEKLNCIWRQHLYWIKTNPAPRYRKKNFAAAVEEAVWFTKETIENSTFNYQLGHHPNYFVCPGVHHSKRIHQTQKPEKLLKFIIAYLTNPGDIVADFFCGSGSSLKAAAQLGRRIFGCDIDHSAIERLSSKLK